MTSLTALSDCFMSWLSEAALPLWWSKGADHLCGGFHEALDAQGEPVAANRRARVQARPIYVFATAGDLRWAGPWREAVNHGFEFFLTKYRRDDALYRTVLAPDGSVVDGAAWPYDQAFALFAMAQATRALPERKVELIGEAHALRQALHIWRLREGDFSEPEAKCTHQSNPQMHLLEASLALAEVDDDPVWIALAKKIAGLALGSFIDANGALHEFFADGWAPAPGVDGRIVKPGHQLEWAWLLERWVRLPRHDDAHRAAQRLFQIGIEWGVRDGRGVATQQLLDDGSIYDDLARLWPQTERIKAALILGDYAETARGIQRLNLYLDAPVLGSCRDKLRPDGTFVDEPAPASSFYHIICAVAELKSAAVAAR